MYLGIEVDLDKVSTNTASKGKRMTFRSANHFLRGASFAAAEEHSD